VNATISSGVILRQGTAADIEGVSLLLDTCFGPWDNASEADPDFELFRIEDGIVATEGDRIVGYTGSRRQTVTVPGGRAVAAAMIANVVVALTHRRRGILRSLCARHHRCTVETGLALTVLSSSQGSIYGRFGYGPAIVEHRIEFDRRQAQFLSSTPDPGGVESVPMTVAQQAIPNIYDSWRRSRAGAQARPEGSWRYLFRDYPQTRAGGGGLYALLHDHGYALYRHHSREVGTALEVVELRAVIDDAYTALWRTLVAQELFDRIEASVAPDDPLPLLLTDPRLIRTKARYDTLWARLMNVPAALEARAYLCDLDIVLAVEDLFGAAGGNFALRIRDGVAVCESTTRPADIELGIDALASMYLGAHRAHTLAAANRLRAKDFDTLRAVDLAFGATRYPELGWRF
jgi:predicted acetyltransferase